MLVTEGEVVVSGFLITTHPQTSLGIWIMRQTEGGTFESSVIAPIHDAFHRFWIMLITMTSSYYEAGATLYWAPLVLCMLST